MTDMAKKAFQEQEEVRKADFSCAERLLLALTRIILSRRRTF